MQGSNTGKENYLMNIKSLQREHFGRHRLSNGQFLRSNEFPRGAGRSYTGADNTPEWYQRNKNNIFLSPDTRDYVESLIESETT